jgi:hypothetical protein
MVLFQFSLFKMSIIASSFANLASGFIMQYMPVQNTTLSLQASMFTKDAILFAFNEGKKISVFRYLFRSKPHVIVSNKIEGNNKPNPIYQKIEQYIVDKYLKDLESCQLVPKRGDIVVSMSHMKGSIKDIKDHHNGVDYIIRHVDSSEQIQTQNGMASVKSNSFIIESQNGTFDNIKEYIKYIFELNKMEVKTMRVYQPRAYESKDYTRVDWESLYVKSNKHIGNTILNSNLDDELIGDIGVFLKNQDWYDTRGVPYKRGYILHGPPGTGKTSVIKAIANTYNLPVFTIDFDIIKDNNTLSQLITEINYYHKNTPYILCMEDVDRSKIFNKYKSSNDKCVTTECLLNILDGVVEAYGRIVFMTVNNLDVIQTYHSNGLDLSKALMRPGRIDKILEIGYLEKSQSEKMIQLFYEQDVSLDFDPIGKKISPAELVQVMQVYPTNLDGLLSAFKGKVNGNTPNDSMIPNMLESMGKQTSGKHTRINIRNKYTKTNRLKNDIYALKRQIRLSNNYVINQEKFQKRLDKKLEDLQKHKDKEKMKKLKEKNKQKRQQEIEKKRKMKSTKSISKNKAKKDETEKKVSYYTFNNHKVLEQARKRSERYLNRCV